MRTRIILVSGMTLVVTDLCFRVRFTVQILWTMSARRSDYWKFRRAYTMQYSHVVITFVVKVRVSKDVIHGSKPLVLRMPDVLDGKVASR